MSVDGGLAGTAPASTGAPASSAAASRWHRRPPLLLLTFVAVMVGGTVRFHSELTSPGVEVDMGIYLRAFDHLEGGGSPYAERGFLYTPAFAVLGNAVRNALGTELFVRACRWATLAGAWLLVWAALAGGRWRWQVQALAALVVIWSPLVANAIGCLNASLAIMGPLLAALQVAEQRPLLAGAVAGTANALKPLGLPALLLAMLPQRGRRLAPWVPRMAAVAGVALTGLLLLGHRHLPAMWERGEGFPGRIINVSLVRALTILGAPVHGVVVFVAVTLVAAYLTWRWVDDHRTRVAVGAAASVLALPVNSPGSFLLSLPLQALALELASRRVATARRDGRKPRRAIYELALVAAVVIGIHGAEGAVATGELPTWVQGVVTLMPLADVAALAAYAVARGRALSGDEP